MTIATADLMDRADAAQLQSSAVQFTQFGGQRNCHGPVRTVQTHEDNALIRQLVSSPGEGAVLVVDGAGSLRTALMGDALAALALANGWSGVILYGAVRDVCALAALPLALKALGSNPRKSSKQATGAIDVPVSFGGITFRPGDWVYSDDDGIVVSPHRLHA